MLCNTEGLFQMLQKAIHTFVLKALPFQNRTWLRLSNSVAGFTRKVKRIMYKSVKGSS